MRWSRRAGKTQSLLVESGKELVVKRQGLAVEATEKDFDSAFAHRK